MERASGTQRRSVAATTVGVSGGAGPQCRTPGAFADAEDDPYEAAAAGAVCATGVLIGGALFAAMFGVLGMALSHSWGNRSLQRPLGWQIGQMFGAAMGQHAMATAHLSGSLQLRRLLGAALGAWVAVQMIVAFVPSDLEFETGFTAVSASAGAMFGSAWLPVLLDAVRTSFPHKKDDAVKEPEVEGDSSVV